MTTKAKITYKTKIVIWSLLFFCTIFIPTIIPLPINDNTFTNVTQGMLIYWGVICGFYFLIALFEFKFFDVSIVTWLKTLAIFIMLSLMLSLGSLAMLSISFQHFGHTETMGIISVVIFNLMIAITMTVVFAYTIRILWLITTNHHMYRGHEISIRLAWKSLIYGWILKETTDGDVVLLTKKSTYILHFVNTRKNKVVTFEHRKEKSKLPGSYNELNLDSDRYNIVHDDELIAKYKVKMKQIETTTHHKTFASTIFVYEFALPTIYGQNSRMAFSTIANLPVMLKAAESKLNKKLENRKELVNLIFNQQPVISEYDNKGLKTNIVVETDKHKKE